MTKGNLTPKQLESTHLTGDMHLKTDFMKLDGLRGDLIERCEQYAGWTIPHLFPRDEVSMDEMQYDYQSVGAQAVTHLANKIMMTLFQPSQPFFRLNLSQTQINEIKATTNLTPASIEETLAKAEKESVAKFRRTNGRAVLTDVEMLLIITGNAMVSADVNEPLQYWSLRDYVVTRDLKGNILRIIFRETKSLSSMDDHVAQLAKAKGIDDPDAELTIYTGVRKVSKDRYIVYQELEDLCYIHKQMGIYTEDTLPWLVLVWNRSRDRDYGTGLVENYAGAFHSLSTVSEAALDYLTILTDLKNLVDPTGMTDVTQIAEAPSGAYVPGREEDIFVHTPNVQAASDYLDRKEQALVRTIASAFLMNSKVTRDAERVTAEEIRLQAHELEGSLGGIYSRQTTDLQLPFAKRLAVDLDPMFKEIEPEIITGLESLSRTSDLDRMRMMFQDLIALSEVPPEVADRIKYNDLIAMLGTGHQVEYQKFLKDEDQVKADRAQRSAELAQQEGAVAGEVAAAQAQA